MLDIIDQDLLRESEGQLDDNYWTYKSIIGHQGPLQPNDPNYQGSRYNVLVHWSTDEKTSVPLDVMAVDGPTECAIYARDKGLLDDKSWSRFKQLLH